MSQRLRPLLKIPINLTYRLNLTWNCATNGKKASLAHIEDEAKRGGRAQNFMVFLVWPIRLLYSIKMHIYFVIRIKKTLRTQNCCWLFLFFFKLFSQFFVAAFMEG